MNRKILAVAVVIVSVLVFTTSCSRSITVEQAANGRARCGKFLR